MDFQKDINEYLLKVKKAEIKVVERSKNRLARYSLGITIDEMNETIKNLKASEYYSGPEKDHDVSRIGDVWVFKPYYKGKRLYVKIKMENDKEVKVLSFHEDEYQ